MLRRLGMHMRNIKIFMISSKIAAMLLLLSFLFLSIAGCAHPGSEVNTGIPITPSPVPSQDPNPVQGGTLRLPMPENITAGNSKLNPLLVKTKEMYQVYSLVFDPLIAVDESNGLVPSLARSWTSFDGGWLLNLRSDVKWHDGSGFTADDVVETFNALKAIGGDSYFSDALVNVNSITKVDELTVQVQTRDPGLISLYSLNIPIIKANSDKLMFGTGAYRADVVTDDRIVLNVNAEWWDKTPYFETVEFLARGSNDLAIASYGAGMLDLVPSSQLTVGQYASAGETIVADCMTQQIETLLINHANKYLADVRFRKAIAQLIDRSSIITNIYMNKARSSDVPFPPDSWLYDGTQVAYDYDVESAKKILMGMGFSWDGDEKLVWGHNQVKLRLLCGSITENTIRADAAALIADNLNAVGIEVELINIEHDIGNEDDPFLLKLSEGEWDLAAVGFNLSQGNDLSRYLFSDGNNNYGNYRDVNMENLIGQMKNMRNEQELRNRAYEVQAYFAQELPFIVLYFRLDSVIYTTRINGVGTLRDPNLLRGIQNWYFIR